MNENSVLYKIKSLDATIIRKIESGIDETVKVRKNLPTITQMRIIEYILSHEREDIYQRDLEKVLNLRRATVSGVLQTMEKNLLIKRTSSVLDARTKKIVLNETAKNLFLQGEKKLKMLEKVIVEGISEEELTIFSSVVDKMNSNINNYQS